MFSYISCSELKAASRAWLKFPVARSELNDCYTCSAEGRKEEPKELSVSNVGGAFNMEMTDRCLISCHINVLWTKQSSALTLLHFAALAPHIAVGSIQ